LVLLPAYYCAIYFLGNNISDTIIYFCAAMNILLLGSGGREHALAHKLSASTLCDALYIAPGNAGTQEFGTNVPLNSNDFEAIASYCIAYQIQMIVVGPEDPLVKGIYDFITQADATKHIMVIGPSKFAAQLEGSKSFSKQFMQRHNIPTASYAEFTADTFNDGLDYLQQHTLPIVLKADGLAAGKGVVICQTHTEAITEFTAMIQDQKFGTASAKVVVEQFLDGIEMSVFALTDGKNYVLLPSAKDYKKIGEGDTGLNTGGMGAVSPVPFADDEWMQKVIHQIVEPTINGLHQEQIVYKGFVFIGLIKVNNEPFVIEYNCRLGDPETEVILPRLQSDLVELFVHTHHQTLHTAAIQHSPQHACTVMCVSGGYPQSYTNGFAITGLDNVTNAKVYHAGTAQQGDTIVTNGGRVLAITSLADTLAQAVDNSIKNAAKINFDRKYFRTDIGFEF
jgi:phosphoribosylamine---glycine ligase